MRYIKYAMLTALVASAASANVLDLGSISVSGANEYVNASFTILANQPLRLFLGGGLPHGLPDGPSCVSNLSTSCLGNAGYSVSSFDKVILYDFGPGSSVVNIGSDTALIPAGPITITFSLSQFFSVPSFATLPVNTLAMSLSTDTAFQPSASISLASSFAVRASTPEPSTWLLLASGCALIALRHYRCRHRATAHRA